VHLPGEIIVDPWLYSISLTVHALENGADIYTMWNRLILTMGLGRYGEKLTEIM
jgi:hypothetical protein